MTDLPAQTRLRGVRGRVAAGASDVLPSLLWVDDDFTTLETGGELLAIEGFSVDFATTGSEGICLARTHAYRGIILDMALPDCSGIDVLRAIRERDSSTPVAILTGHASLQNAVAAGRLDIFELWEKPAIGEDLIDRVRRLAADVAPYEPTVDFQSIVRRLRGLAPPSRTAKGSPATIVLRAALLEPGLSTVEFAAVCRAVKGAHHVGFASAVLDAAWGLSQGLTDEARFVLAQVDVAVRTQSAGGFRKASGACGMTERGLSLAVRAAGGLRVCHLMAARRVRPSIELLLNGVEQVAQIAYRLGYDHPTQFDRDFKLLLGATPSAFRRRF